MVHLAHELMNPCGSPEQTKPGIAMISGAADSIKLHMILTQRGYTGTASIKVATQKEKGPSPR
jgi:hypothetical protein